MAPQYSTILHSLRQLAALSFGALAVHGCSAVTTTPSGVPPEWDGSVGVAQDASSVAWDAASACRPGNLQTYYPRAYRAASTGSGVCLGTASGDPIQLFYDDCLGPNASSALCDAFKSDKTNAACADCILTPAAAQQYGPLVGHDTFISANVAGCVELEEPAGLGCAKAIQALADCELAACEANCPVTDSKTFAAYSACASDADQTGCRAYVNAAACQQVYQGADSGVRPCLTSSFVDFYQSVAVLFCRTPPPTPETAVDAGASDAEAADAGVVEASHTDAAVDASAADASALDAHSVDARPVDARAAASDAALD